MQQEDIIIVGAGPIGLACAISAKRRGLGSLVIDAGAVCESIRRYPVGMTFFTTPERLEIGDHPLVCSGAKPTREEALKYYRGVARTESLRVRTFTRLADAARTEDGIRCVLHTSLGDETAHCSRLVLATGYFEQPKLLEVPGEGLPHVSHYFDEAHIGYNLDVVVIGGRNSAVEAALDLFRAGARVSLVYRGNEFPRSVKYWMKPDIENRIKAGEIDAHLGSTVLSIDKEAVTIRDCEGVQRSLPADRVYALTGFCPDLDLFRSIGVHVDAETGVPELNPETLETNVPGVHIVGSPTRGNNTSNVFIENGRFDGEKVFGDPESRKRAHELYEGIQRAYGE